MDIRDNIKESLKFEYEKLRLFGLFEAGLATYLGSVVLKENHGDKEYILGSLALLLLIVFVSSTFISLQEIRSLFKLLKRN